MEIPIIADSIQEPDENFVVILSVLEEINGEINPDRATVTILNGKCNDSSGWIKGAVSCRIINLTQARQPKCDNFGTSEKCPDLRGVLFSEILTRMCRSMLSVWEKF